MATSHLVLRITKHMEVLKNTCFVQYDPTLNNYHVYGMTMDSDNDELNQYHFVYSRNGLKQFLNTIYGLNFDECYHVEADMFVYNYIDGIFEFNDLTYSDYNTDYLNNTDMTLICGDIDMTQSRVNSILSMLAIQEE